MSELLDALRKEHITRVVAAFAGSGDEGSVHEIKVTRVMQTHGGAVVVEEDLVEDPEMWDAISDICHTADFDWWNNEGGHGTATIEVAKAKVTFTRFAYESVEKDLGETTVEL